jgi:hypothetical protein
VTGYPVWMTVDDPAALARHDLSYIEDL